MQHISQIYINEGDRICIIVRTNALYSSVVIVDNGVGIFQTLVEYMVLATKSLSRNAILLRIYFLISSLFL